LFRDFGRVWGGCARYSLAAAAGAWFAALGSAAAQTIPPPALSVKTGNVFVWADGSYRSVHLPDYGLGFYETSTTTFEKIGAVHTFKPRASGGGVSGGAGVMLPPSTLPGTNARVALTGRFIDASASQSAIASSNGNVIQLLDGFLIGPCGTCQLPTRLDTDVRNWQLGLAAATEFHVSRLIVTPSVELVGGMSRVGQTYSQVRIVGGGPNAYYDAATKVRWADAGAKLGVAFSVPVMPMVELGVGGTLTTVYRHATLDGNDRLDDGFGFIATSTVGLSRSTVAVIPGVEAQVTVRPRANIQLRAFGGIERDNRVPGIVAPRFTPDEFLAGFATGITATPASIGFSSHTTYYAGGGIAATFAP
jgi:hypothetical protein